MSLLLFVDEDPPQHIPHVRLLSAEGHQVVTCDQSSSATEWLKQNRPELILLTWCDCGAQLCRQWRAETAAPIIVLTTASAGLQHELIMESGAERYVIEPCAPRELVVHVRNTLSRAAPLPRLLRAGDLVLDLGAQRAVRNGRLLSLTRKEYQLLTELMSHEGMVLTREMLLERVWGEGHAQHSRTLDVHIGWLRKKIEDEPNQPRRIRTIPRQGYCFEG